jgi:TPR repeat protein
MACGLDNGNGCFSLGVIYKNDENTKKNDFKAVKFYQKACDLGNSSGCLNLGVMHEDGTGAEKSNFKAVKFYQKACDLNDSNGCFNLGVMYKDGTGIKQIHHLKSTLLNAYTIFIHSTKIIATIAII